MKRRSFCFGPSMKTKKKKKTLFVKKQKKKRLCARIERKIGGKSKKSKKSTWSMMKEAERPLTMRRRRTM